MGRCAVPLNKSISYLIHSVTPLVAFKLCAVTSYEVLLSLLCFDYIFNISLCFARPKLLYQVLSRCILLIIYSLIRVISLYVCCYR